MLGVLFVQWPEHAVWNTRFLPFWLLTWGFLAAMGAAEIVRLVAMRVAPWRTVDTRQAICSDAAPRVGRHRASTSDPTSIPRCARKRRRRSPSGASTPTRPAGSRPSDSSSHAQAVRSHVCVGTIALAVIVGVAGIFALRPRVERAQRQPGHRDHRLGA